MTILQALGFDAAAQEQFRQAFAYEIETVTVADSAGQTWTGEVVINWGQPGIVLIPEGGTVNDATVIYPDHLEG